MDGTRRIAVESTARRLHRLMTAVLLPTMLLVGCKSPQSWYCQQQVASELANRTGGQLGPEGCPGETAIPTNVNLDDGLTEEEAVTTALWNNAAYRELLAQLGISNAQLYNAGLLTDPQMTMFLPLGTKQLEFTIFFIVDAVWLRPIRERAASLDLANVSQTMVQNGLNTIRDTRLAHADLLFTQDRSKLADEAAKLQKEIADFAEKRFKAGDIAKLEVTNAEVDSLRAQADAARFAQDVTLAKNRLRTLMGLTLQDVTLNAVDGQPVNLTDRSSDELVHEALAFRPDLRAAEINVQTACERTTLAKWQFINFDAVFDANADGEEGWEAGPGLRMTIPIFNANRGNIAIASEQIRQANRQMITVRDQITLDVRTAYVQMKQAAENLQAVREKMLPKLKTAVELATKNYRAGGATYFLVLQTTRQYLDLRIRELELELALRRAIAELERSVGHRLDAKPNPPPAPANGNDSACRGRLAPAGKTPPFGIKDQPRDTAQTDNEITKWARSLRGGHASGTRPSRVDRRVAAPVRAAGVRKEVRKVSEEIRTGQGRGPSVRSQHRVAHAHAESGRTARHHNGRIAIPEGSPLSYLGGRRGRAGRKDADRHRPLERVDSVTRQKQDADPR